MNAVKKWFERLPIGGKLTMLASLVSGLALLISGLVLTIADYRADQHEMWRRLQTQAQITARDSEAAVAFEDNEAANPLVVGIERGSAIVAAEIRRSGDQSAGALRPRPGSRAERPDLIHVAADIVLDGNIGTVHLWAKRQELHAALLKRSLVLAMVIVGALVFASLAALRMQRFVSKAHSRPVRGGRERYSRTRLQPARACR